MSDSIENNESGEELEINEQQLESERKLDDATFDPGTVVERDGEIESSEAIESAMSEIVTDDTSESAMPDEVPSVADDKEESFWKFFYEGEVEGEAPEEMPPLVEDEEAINFKFFNKAEGEVSHKKWLDADDGEVSHRKRLDEPDSEIGHD